MSSHVVGPGDLIAGRYRIERLLGQGGMGSVYEAVQLSLGRRVALKLLVDEAGDHPAHVARFEREAVALARLTDQHTVRLFDFGTDEHHRPFLVMELLQGWDLASDLERHGPMRWDQALRVSRQVLASLAEAHATGIIHRDIKPANLFLCAAPEWPVVRVLDFGIAAASAGERAARKLTLTGTVLGSAPYMSPEQAQGQEAGPAADLYALGVVLFELLTRSTPFEGRTLTAQLLAKVLVRAPELREVRAELDIPDGVQALVAELLEREAAARPPSACAVAERMTALLEEASLPPLVRAVGAAPMTWQPLVAPRTEPMLLPRTLDNWWTPPTMAPLHPARPVSHAPRRLPVLAAGALLVSLGVLGWELRPPRSEGSASALGAGPASGALGANGPPSRGAAVDLRAENVLASAAERAHEDEPAPAASESAAPAPDGTGQGSRRPRQAPQGLVAGDQRAAQPPKAKAARRPRRKAAESEGLPPATAQRPDPSAVWPVPPSAVELPLPRAQAAAAPADQPRAQQGLTTIESAAAEPSGGITPTQRDDIIAALRERRRFARSRAAREYRDGLIDRAEFRARLREIEREIGGSPGWNERELVGSPRWNETGE